jgi:hypothetical protein
MFQTGTLITDEAQDDFFKWVGSQPERLRIDRDRDEAACAFLFVVDEAMREEWNEVAPAGATSPEPGVYAAVWDSDGVIHAFSYGNALETAVTEFNAGYPPYGEDPGDWEDTGRLTVVRTRKPAAVCVRSEATVRVDGAADYEEVLAFGLAALGESKGRLTDWRVRPEGTGSSTDMAGRIENLTVIVTAYKD